MPPLPRPFVFTLTPDEIAELTPPSGEGGHQGFHDMLRDQLQKTGNVVTLNDSEFGQLVPLHSDYDSLAVSG